jgi:hypothetical protein
LEIIASGFFEPAVFILDNIRYTAKGCEARAERGKGPLGSLKRRLKLLKKLHYLGGTPIKLYAIDLPTARQRHSHLRNKSLAVGEPFQSERERFTPEFRAFHDQLEPYFPRLTDIDSKGGEPEIELKRLPLMEIAHGDGEEEEKEIRRAAVKLQKPSKASMAVAKLLSATREVEAAKLKLPIRQLSACDIIDCDFNSGTPCHYTQGEDGGGKK